MLTFIFIFHKMLPQSFDISSFLNEKTKRTDLKIVIDTDDDSHYLPISIINGKENGKTITIIAGIHGYEYPPIMTVQKILQDIDPHQLRGNLIIIPIANIAAFQKRVPFLHPSDNKNLNYIFPGSENGTISEKIAHFITKNIIPISDIFIDIHGGDANEDLIPFVCYYDEQSNPQNTLMAEQLAEVCIMPYIVSFPYNISKTEQALYAFKQAVQDNVVGLSLEAGKLGTNDPKDVELITESVYNMLNFLNIYPKINPKNTPIKFEKFNQNTYIKAPATGIFYSSKKAGDFIKKSEELGYITDEFGNILLKIIAPESGLILYKIGTPPVNKDETLFCIVW